MRLRRMVYVWEFPVRFFHWLNALCIALLFLTGLYMGHPLFSPPGEAYRNFALGWVRYVHFLTAYFLVAIWLFRVYWFFVGNAYAKNVFRFWSLDAWRSVGRHARSLLLASPTIGQEMPGQDQLARMMHGLLFTSVVVMIVTGFAMYGEINPTGLPFRLTQWVFKLAGGGRPVVTLHHLVAWFFPFFTVAHLYQVFRTDHLSGQGLVSSMLTGYYYLHEKQEQKVEEQMAGD